MPTASAHVPTNSLSVSRIGVGIVGGLAGRVLFGLLMSMMAMIKMVAILVHSESVAAG